MGNHFSFSLPFSQFKGSVKCSLCPFRLWDGLDFCKGQLHIVSHVLGFLGCFFIGKMLIVCEVLVSSWFFMFVVFEAFSTEDCFLYLSIRNQFAPSAVFVLIRPPNNVRSVEIDVFL